MFEKLPGFSISLPALKWGRMTRKFQFYYKQSATLSHKANNRPPTPVENRVKTPSDDSPEKSDSNSQSDEELVAGVKFIGFIII